MPKKEVDHLQFMLLHDNQSTFKEYRIMLYTLTYTLLHKLRSGELRAWGRRNSAFDECMELPASGWSYVHVKDVDWYNDKIFSLIPDQTVYDIRIAPANSESPADVLEDMFPGPITEVGQTIPVSMRAPKRCGPKPELKNAMRDVFLAGLENPEIAIQLKAMTQNLRRRYVGQALTLSEDEWPSRSWCDEVWREVLKPATLPEL